MALTNRGLNRRERRNLEILRMDVILAGYNLDKELIERAKRGECASDMVFSPESISAAYARISRDPDPVNILREKARRDIVRARKSNRRIVFDMGHHSVAEHVIFNIDIIGISRLAVESLEEARLCAYTEKSQRYVTLDGDSVMPQEFQQRDRELFKQLTHEQNQLYLRAFPALLELQKRKNPQLYELEHGRATIEGWAKEDARFALNLATETQLGFSPNARNLEYVIRKLRHHPLSEVRELGHKLFAVGSEIAPSLIILSDPKAFKEQFGWEVSDAFIQGGRLDLKSISEKMFSRFSSESDQKNTTASAAAVSLVDHCDNPDVAVVASLLHSTSEHPKPYDYCVRIAREMQRADMHIEYIKQALEKLTEYDAVFREFEHATFTFEISVSASEFAQWKRHRMMTLTKQPYDPSLGYSYPEAVIEVGLEPVYRDLFDKTTEVFLQLQKRYSQAAQYALTNGHKRRALITVNMRELYHIARLRMDEHAQWEIRNTAAEMISRVAEIAPATAFLACGKGGFHSRRGQLYNRD
ncbi:MAG: FAD-dependent thymidylate synthase [Deltaproteobacteria bacterium]|nr:FAD-dependent thymidylate synthase [Deltaproteobacteria bacterium]